MHRIRQTTRAFAHHRAGGFVLLADVLLGLLLAGVLLATIAAGLAMHQRAQQRLDAQHAALRTCEATLSALQLGEAPTSATLDESGNTDVRIAVSDVGPIDPLPGWRWVTVSATIPLANGDVTQQLSGAVPEQAIVKMKATDDAH